MQRLKGINTVHDPGGRAVQDVDRSHHITTSSPQNLFGMPLSFSILCSISHHNLVAVLYNPVLLWGVGRGEVSLHLGVGEEDR
jgi:hypothetical protein